MNGIGTVFKSITGNLDAEDGEKIYRALDILENDRNSMHKLLEEQTSLTINAIAEINKTISALAHNQEQIANQINVLQYAVKNIVTQQLTSYNRIQILELFTQLSVLLNGVQSIILTTENAITFSKQNIFHTSILKPQFIRNEFETITSRVTNSKLLTTSDLTLYEKVFNIKATQNQFQIIFIIDIPLVEKSDYSYYQLYSIPVEKTSKSFSIILPQSKYLILNEQHYASRDDECKELEDQLYLCKNDNPTEINENSPCEVKLIAFQRPIDNCIQEEIKITKTSVSKYGNLQYIIVAPNETRAILRCPDQENSKVLKGTYMAKLQPKCQLIIDGTIYTSNQPSSETQQTFLVPMLETVQNAPLEETQLPELRLENVPLNNLDNIRAQLQTEKQRIPKNLQIPMYRTSIWTIILYVSVIIFAIIVISKWIRTRRIKSQNQKKPLEIPRK